MILFSCSKDQLQDPFQEEGFQGICFETEILPLMVSSCGNSGCHNSIDQEEDLDLTHYAGILEIVKKRNPSDSKLIKVVREDEPQDIMPPPPAPPLSQDQIRLLEDWIQEGAPDTVNCNTSSCTEKNEYSYSEDVYPIFTKYCVGCHNEVTPQGGHQFSSYQGTKLSLESGRLIGSLEFKPGFSSMPLNSAPLPSCQLSTIQSWVAQGAKNN
jgi:hypothetical protein